MDSHSQRSGREDSAGEKGQLPHMLQNNHVRIVIIEVQTIPELYYKRFILCIFIDEIFSINFNTTNILYNPYCLLLYFISVVNPGFRSGSYSDF